MLIDHRSLNISDIWDEEGNVRKDMKDILGEVVVHGHTKDRGRAKPWIYQFEIKWAETCGHFHQIQVKTLLQVKLQKTSKALKKSSASSCQGQTFHMSQRLWRSSMRSTKGQRDWTPKKCHVLCRWGSSGLVADECADSACTGRDDGENGTADHFRTNVLEERLLAVGFTTIFDYLFLRLGFRKMCCFTGQMLAWYCTVLQHQVLTYDCSEATRVLASSSRCRDSCDHPFSCSRVGLLCAGTLEC